MMIETLARRPDTDPAIVAPDMGAMTYGMLVDHIEGTAATLSALGLGAEARIAVVAQNSPATASLLLVLMSVSCAAPLNPSLREEDFAAALRDLRADALVVVSGEVEAASRAADTLGVRVLDLVDDGRSIAGRFALRPRDGSATRHPHSAPPSQPEDVALVLQTSGTTARPKTVPLTRAQLAVSAANVAATLELTSADRCLALMPLFHIHGIVATVLATLHSGGTVYVPAAPNALRAFAWLDDSRATWFSAVPTMHQSFLSHVRRRPDGRGGGRLRFVRSSSAPLPPATGEQLEATFGCPAVEAYGMTEAAHQIASNPVAPGARRFGTVGAAAGPDIAVVDAEGRSLPPGTEGEVIIRGPNVITAYENAGGDDASFLPGGWLRTGDRGRLDDDGFLTLTGRLKELINRGGEKISPFEVDTVVSEHPAVHQAVTFALPSRKLGEEVAVAVVLAEGSEASEDELIAFAADRLAAFKRPRRVVILDAIPTGPTGKPQRIGLARRLGLGVDATAAPPRP